MTYPSSTVLIRTNAGQYTGIGHLVRCLQLAEQLVARQAKVIFVLDFIETNITPFLTDYLVETLYDEVQAEISAQEDAIKFVKLLNQYQATHVIIDDYRLDHHWEKSVKHHHQKPLTLVAIDDILREHDCDILVDMKWRGDDTQNAYDHLLPQQAIKLLGPKYVLLNKQYQNNEANLPKWDISQKEPTAINSQNSSSPFTVMLGLGGGGDLAQFQQLLDNVLNSKHSLNVHLKILVVLGPLSTNSQALIKQYADNDQVELLIGKTDLYPYLQKTHLYIGAAGGILYQLLALNIPALTFAIADNQASEKTQLAQLGHYFHLDNLSELMPEKLVYFIESISTHYPRIINLLQNAETKIDAMGASRVAEQILSLNKTPCNGQNTTTDSNIDSNLSSKNVDELHQKKPSVKSNEYLDFPGGYQLRAVDDSDVNHYLACRNLPSNCQNMINAEPIPYLSHYTWWFNAKRDSFLLSQAGKPVLYIWHEIKPHFQQRKAYYHYTEITSITI